jgi:hypothetical protein
LRYTENDDPASPAPAANRYFVSANYGLTAWPEHVASANGSPNPFCKAELAGHTKEVGLRAGF